MTVQRLFPPRPVPPEPAIYAFTRLGVVCLTGVGGFTDLAVISAMIGNPTAFVLFCLAALALAGLAWFDATYCLPTDGYFHRRLDSCTWRRGVAPDAPVPAPRDLDEEVRP